MLPRLVGEENIQAANRTAVGSGTLEASARTKIVDVWQRHAAGPRKRSRVVADVRTLGGIGIGVRAAPAAAGPSRKATADGD